MPDRVLGGIADAVDALIEERLHLVAAPPRALAQRLDSAVAAASKMLASVSRGTAVLR